MESCWEYDTSVPSHNIKAENCTDPFDDNQVSCFDFDDTNTQRNSNFQQFECFPASNVDPGRTHNTSNNIFDNFSTMTSFENDHINSNTNQSNEPLNPFDLDFDRLSIQPVTANLVDNRSQNDLNQTNENNQEFVQNQPWATNPQESTDLLAFFDPSFVSPTSSSRNQQLVSENSFSPENLRLQVETEDFLQELKSYQNNLNDFVKEKLQIKDEIIKTLQNQLRDYPQQAQRIYSLEQQISAFQRNYEQHLTESSKEAWKLIEHQKNRIVLLEGTLRKCQRDEKTKEDRSLCIVCMDRARNILYLDCNHCCVCLQCSDFMLKNNQKDCPICSRGIKHRLNIIFP